MSKEVDSGLIQLFVKLGLSEQKAGETAKNKKLSAQLKEVTELVSVIPP
jgi:hypothetical protein